MRGNPQKSWGRMGVSARASPGDTADSAGSVSSPEFAAIGKPDKQAITPIAPHSPNGLAMTHGANFFETAGTERDRGVAASNGNLAL